MNHPTSSTLFPGTYFVTGTDTDVGKTICTKALLQAANKQQKSTLAYKPISAGCDETSQGLRNEDALILQQNSHINVAYEAINPIAYKQPIAPHIAAIENKRNIDLTLIDQGLLFLQQQKPDYLFVEGAGGWHLPVDHKKLFSEWVIEHKLPIILVVGLKLGCLNHALLTVESIKQAGLPIAGWIANHLQSDMPYVEQNIDTLSAYINAPLLAEIPFLQDINNQDLASYININF
ncbi:dethiobiotin synthase [Psychromonas sp. RZ22]|uniref:dethiobiotin synthase n=1 Tax=Psychromonas algarum TaxID=2555643 RepID=UPI00106732E5|nr:dethiobiotin synthase [Psychromonas sp. RZ22]TEW55214.1 dethiobiotin synthase [Psychromonas sp. RZ22]